MVYSSSQSMKMLRHGISHSPNQLQAEIDLHKSFQFHQCILDRKMIFRREHSRINVMRWECNHNMNTNEKWTAHGYDRLCVGHSRRNPNRPTIWHNYYIMRFSIFRVHFFRWGLSINWLIIWLLLFTDLLFSKRSTILATYAQFS